MDAITFASPFTVSTQNNSSIISRLRNYKSHHSTESIPSVLIPVLESEDIEDIVSQNNRRRAGGNRRAEDKRDVEESEVEVVGGDEEHVEPKKYVRLENLLPTNRQQQLATVFLEDFPALRKNLIERVIELVVGVAPAEIPRSFEWSVLEQGSTGSQSELTNVFVRFASMETAGWLLANVDGVAPIWKGVVTIFDPELEAGTANIDDEKAKKAADEMARMVANKNNYSVDTKSTGTEDLDQVMQYYRTYKVANSELVEVPKELKETIVKDIIKFRAKVLTIERDRRKKEIERERRMAKLRLTQFVEGIKSAAEISKDTDMEVEMAEEKTDPLDALTEEEYEEHLAKEKKTAEEQEYNVKLAEMERLETAEKGKLLEQLDSAVNYESNLVDNKFALIDEVKEFLDRESATLVLHRGSNLQLYYTNHSEYVRVRLLERTREEKMDKLDKEDEDATSEETQPSVVAEVVPTKEVDQTEDVTMEVDVVVSQLPPEKLSAIQDKIGELIEEYLGIRAEVLIDFIFDFVKENNLARKDDLVAELLETLDEDSITVVDQLHEFVRLSVTG